MAPISIDPTLNPSDVHSAIHIHNPTDTNSLSHGDIVESWDFTFKWDEHCRTADELEKFVRHHRYQWSTGKLMIPSCSHQMEIHP
jgi:hypothetical protein